MAKQQTNGKALEYCFALIYDLNLTALGLNVNLIADKHFLKAKKSYDSCDLAAQSLFLSAAKSSFDSMVKIEPGLVNQIDATDTLLISIASDAAGIAGDVRDVLFKRKNWEIGFSVKNNHDASKHSRLSPLIDFGKEWLGHPCSANYFVEINLVFDLIKAELAANPLSMWKHYPNKDTAVYVPILTAFKRELMLLNATHSDIPKKLLTYLIGRNSFYKVTKHDRYNLVVAKGYNMNKDLGLPYNGNHSVCGIPKIVYPTRIIEFTFDGSTTTLFMTLDKGWQIKFRIHSADTLLQTSLKFDIELVGNPPILFTHHMF